MGGAWSHELGSGAEMDHAGRGFVEWAGLHSHELGGRGLNSGHRLGDGTKGCGLVIWAGLGGVIGWEVEAERGEGAGLKWTMPWAGLH